MWTLSQLHKGEQMQPLQLTPEELSQAFLMLAGLTPTDWPEILDHLSEDQWEMVALLLAQILEVKERSSLH
jgi:hypothetical protein